MGVPEAINGTESFFIYGQLNSWLIRDRKIVFAARKGGTPNRSAFDLFSYLKNVLGEIY